MKKASDIRARFLEFYRERGHEVVPSSPVIPHGDPTLLFTNAGMNQFKDVFLGREKRSYVRATSAQKCIRAGGKHNDLENVGQTARHQTFFEMLGNFSFGDYFKSEAIPWAWELCTEVFGFDPERLHATVFEEDDEAARVWAEWVKLPAERIHRLGAKDNFWAMGDTGPCGPCSEIHFDRGPEHACGDACALGVCDCDRWIEFYNLVFMQFDQREGGERVALPAPSVDTGMGLERVVMLLNGFDSNYETDVIRPLIDEVTRVSGVAYTPGPDGMPHRVIADHIRCLTAAIADRALPGNQGRGYVLKRILRRAARYGRQIGLTEPFLCDLVPKVDEILGAAYPEIHERKKHVAEVIRGEEVSFNRTLDRGIELFEELAKTAGATPEKASPEGSEPGGVIPGKDAFRLYETFGFPIDLTQLMAREQGLSVDMTGFTQCMTEHQEVSAAGGKGFKLEGLSEAHGKIEEPTVFSGYRLVEDEGVVLSATPDEIITDCTPFYAEGGGQVGDTGLIFGKDPGWDFEFEVADTQRIGEVYVHRGKFVKGGPDQAKRDVPVGLQVDAARRADIKKNHTGTHLLHWALKSVLGDHAAQRGSLVAPGYLRFDFEHPKQVPVEEIEEVERLINERVLHDTEVGAYESSYQQAIRDGVTALFGEKYGEHVRVVDIGGYSRELCGGTHCDRTGEIGYLMINAEKKIGGNIHRIEAKTGLWSVQDAIEERRILRGLSRELKTEPAKLLERINAMQQQIKELRGKKQQAAVADVGTLAKELLAAAKNEGGVDTVIAQVDDLDPGALRELVDRLRKGKVPVVATVASVKDGSVALVAGVSKALTEKGLSASKILGEVARLVGGKGGGRDDMAQGGGKDVGQVAAALERARELVRELAAKAT